MKRRRSLLEETEKEQENGMQAIPEGGRSTATESGEATCTATKRTRTSSHSPESHPPTLGSSAGHGSATGHHHQPLGLLDLPDVALGVLIGEWLDVKSAIVLRSTCTAALALVERHNALVTLLLKDLVPAVRALDFWANLPADQTEGSVVLPPLPEDIFDRYALASAVDHFLRKRDGIRGDDNDEEADSDALTTVTGEQKERANKEEDKEAEPQENEHEELPSKDEDEEDDDDDQSDLPLEDGELEGVTKEGREFIDTFSPAKPAGPGPAQPQDASTNFQSSGDASERAKLVQKLDALSDTISAVLRQREIEEPSFAVMMSSKEDWGVAPLKECPELMAFFKCLRVRYYKSVLGKKTWRKECLLEVMPKPDAIHKTDQSTFIYLTESRLCNEDSDEYVIHMYKFNALDDEGSRLFTYVPEVGAYYNRNELNNLAQNLGLFDLKLGMFHMLLHCGDCVPDENNEDLIHESVEDIVAAIGMDMPQLEWSIEKPPRINSEHVSRQLLLSMEQSPTAALLFIQDLLERLRFRIELVRTLNLVPLYDWLDYDDLAKVVPHIVRGRAQCLGMTHWNRDQALWADGNLRLTLPNASEGEYLEVKCTLEARISFDVAFNALVFIRASSPALAKRLDLNYPDETPVLAADGSSEEEEYFTLITRPLIALAKEFEIPDRPIHMAPNGGSLEEMKALQMAALLSVCSVAAATPQLRTVIPKIQEYLVGRTVHPSQAVLSEVFDADPSCDDECEEEADEEAEGQEDEEEWDENDDSSEDEDD